MLLSLLLPNPPRGTERVELLLLLHKMLLPLLLSNPPRGTEGVELLLHKMLLSLLLPNLPERGTSLPYVHIMTASGILQEFVKTQDW
jgi:hypothetical protein